MNTEIHKESTESTRVAEKSETPNAEEAGRIAKEGAAAARKVINAVEEAAGNAADATTNAARHATETAKEIYQSASVKAGDALETSKDYVRRNPVPVVLGALAFGAAVGYLLLTPRRKPTFSERYADEPLAAVREAILEALAPVTQRVHRGYDSARDGAGKVIDRVHHVGSGRAVETVSDQIGRIGNSLKFW